MPQLQAPWHTQSMGACQTHVSFQQGWGRTFYHVECHITDSNQAPKMRAAANTPTPISRPSFPLMTRLTALYLLLPPARLPSQPCNSNAPATHLRSCIQQ